jgi:eukaryotic-like serine/threonine-protein kinase
MSIAAAIRELPVRAGSQADATSAAPSKPTVRFGEWRLEAIIAEGRWNRVYRATSAASSGGLAQYAIKVLHERFWDDPTAVARLRSEATVGRCVMHAHVVPVVASHVHRSPYYVAMPLLHGANAAAVIKARGRLPLSLVLWTVRQIAEGLAAMHTLGYAHGDVRAANICIGSEGHATLLDLSSAARDDGGDCFGDRPLLGSIESLAPEQHAGRLATPQSDLYGLGLAMYHMLAGRLPWRSSDAGVIAAWKMSSQNVDVREYSPGVPGAVSRFIRRLMAVDPLRRPGSAHEVAEELVRLEISTLPQQVF